MFVKFLYLVVIMCISTSALLAAPAEETHTNKKKEAKSKPTADKTEGISPFRYVAGGILSILPGFGLGHAIQGRWFNDYGWVFTVGQTIALVGADMNNPDMNNPTSCTVSTTHSVESCETEESKRKRKIQPYWITAFALLKLGEVIHAWWPSKLTSLQRGQTINDATVIPRHHYLWGGALGTTVGFGLGHAVQGRWWQQGRGWIYTLTQLPIFSAIYSQIVVTNCEERAREKERERKHEGESWGCPLPISEDIEVLLVATFIISKIFEVFSVWDIDYNMHRVADNHKRRSLLVLPYVDMSGLGLQLAFSH